MSKKVNRKVSFDFGQTCLLSLEIEFKVIQQLSFCISSNIKKEKRNTCIVHVHYDSLHVDLGKCISVCSMICVKRCYLPSPSVVKVFKVERLKSLLLILDCIQEFVIYISW